MLVTNFDKTEESIYRKAVKLFNNNKIYVDKNAYYGNGVKSSTMSALRCTDYLDLTEFWKIFDNVKLTHRI